MKFAMRATNLLLLLALGGCAEFPDGENEFDEQSSALVTPPTGAMIAPAVPGETSENFPNPERGFYTGYDLLAAGDASRVRRDGNTLAISVVNLEDYRSRSLDSALLGNLRSGFARARTAGIKLVVRFSYNDSFSSDASKSRVLGHISQLTPVLRDNADVIAVLQAGFIGAWGEWHGSTNGLDTPSARAEILAALLAATPASRSIQVRTPMFKDDYRPGPIADDEAYSGSSRSRIGHHNDCFLASTSDLGTYASPIDDWKEYVAEDTRYAPMGGETCKVYTPRSDCDPAIEQMEEHHWSYLNRLYKGSVISRWVSQGCDSEIRRRLGYRFVLRRVAHTERVRPGGVLALEVDVRNVGFAVPFNHRPIEVVLTRGSVRHVARLDSVEGRDFLAGQKVTMQTYLRIPANLEPGTYTLSLRLPDEYPSIAVDSRYAIRFANTGVWSDATGDNVLSRALKIDASASGERDSSATSFVELH